MGAGTWSRIIAQPSIFCTQNDGFVRPRGRVLLRAVAYLKYPLNFSQNIHLTLFFVSFTRRSKIARSLVRTTCLMRASVFTTWIILLLAFFASSVSREFGGENLHSIPRW